MFFFGSEGHAALDRTLGPGYNTLLLRLNPGDLLSACPHREFHTLPGLLDSRAALSNSYRGKKITCPGARDKLNFRQDKHIFSSNVLRTSKKFTDSLFFLDQDKLFDNRTSKNFDVLGRGTSEKF